MKIAVQISGQVRLGQLYLDTFTKYFKDADVFLCILTDNEYGSEAGLKTNADEVEKIVKFFAPKSHIVINELSPELKSQQRTAKMIDIFNKINKSNPDITYDRALMGHAPLGIDDEQCRYFEGIFPPIHWCSQFYNIWKCNQLRQEFEKNNGIKYDLVIRTRFDVQYSGVFPEIDSELTYLLNYAGYGEFIHVDDKFFACSPANADVICDFYNHMGELIEEVNKTIRIPSAGSIEFLFACWLIKNKIKIESLNSLGFVVALNRFIK